MKEIVKKILEKENIQYTNIQKATSGFTNIVYFVDNMVIKIAKEDVTNKKLEKEISIYKSVLLDNIPKYISSGKMDKYTYLIISKIKGSSLYSIWHTLNNEQREKCIAQIANILKVFNGQNTEFLSDEDRITNWEENVLDKLNTNVQGLEKLGIDIGRIKMFVDENIDLFKDNVFGLVYNDAHFDNFLYDDGTLYLIDFDRVMYAPIDYEMLIFKTMVDNPSKFASEQDEDNVFDEDFKEIYDWFKRYYPKMFNICNIDKRIKIYQFNYLCNQALTMKNRGVGDGWAKELAEWF